MLTLSLLPLVLGASLNPPSKAPFPNGAASLPCCVWHHVCLNGMASFPNHGGPDLFRRVISSCGWHERTAVQNHKARGVTLSPCPLRMQLSLIHRYGGMPWHLSFWCSGNKLTAASRMFSHKRVFWSWGDTVVSQCKVVWGSSFLE